MRRSGIRSSTTIRIANPSKGLGRAVDQPSAVKTLDGAEAAQYVSGNTPPPPSQHQNPNTLFDGPQISEEEAMSLIAKSVEGDPFFTLADVAEKLERGNVSLWRFERSVMITEIINYELSNMQAIHVIAAGGDLSELTEQMRPAIEKWAKERGCTNVVVEGRRGWVALASRMLLSELSP